MMPEHTDALLAMAPDHGRHDRATQFSAAVVDVRGCKLALKRAGAGEPLLFLHGTEGLPDWPPFLDALAQHFDVIAPDHPGFGDTPPPPWIDDASDMAYFYLDAIAQLGISGAHVIGHSLGGWIALEMAVRCCRGWRSLTLIDSAGIHVKGASKADIFILDPDQLARMMFADPLLGERAAEQAQAEKYLDLAIRNRTACARLGWAPRFFNPRLERWLHRAALPVHIVWGEQDRIIPPVYAEHFHRLIPRSTLTMVPEAGHVPHLERPDVVATAVQQFLSWL